MEIAFNFEVLKKIPKTIPKSKKKTGYQNSNAAKVFTAPTLYLNFQNNYNIIWLNMDI